jgi:hypothetical protein
MQSRHQEFRRFFALYRKANALMSLFIPHFVHRFSMGPAMLERDTGSAPVPFGWKPKMLLLTPIPHMLGAETGARTRASSLARRNSSTKLYPHSYRNTHQWAFGSVFLTGTLTQETLPVKLFFGAILFATTLYP